MAVTKTPRINQTRWSSGQDAVARTDFDSDAASLEANAALFKQGTLVERPAAGVPGRLYVVLGDSTTANNGKQFYDDGTAWQTVSYSNRITVESNNTESSPTFLVKGGTSETYESFRVDDNAGNRMIGVSPDKTVNIGTTQIASAQASSTAIGLNAVAPSATQVALAAQGVVGQSSPVFSIRHSGGGANLTISVAGTITTGGDVNAANVTGTTAVSSPVISSTASASLKNTTISGVNNSSIPLTVDASSGQQTNVTAWSIAGAGFARINREGDFLSNRRIHIGNNTGSGTTLLTNVPHFLVKNSFGSTQPAARIVAHDSQNGNVFEVTSNVETTKHFSVSAGGNASISGIAYVGSSLSVNGATLDPLYVNGTTPPLEVLTGTATGTFNDRVVLRHSNTSATATSRSVGLLMSLGNEATSGSAFKSAAVYVQSNAASSDTPTLRFNVGSANVMTLDTDSLVNVNGRVYINGVSESIPVLRLAGGLGTKISLYQSPEYDMGIQPAVFYSRGDNFAWYRRGVPSTTAWDAGSGGTTLMTLKGDSDNRLTVGRLTLNDTTGVDSATPLLRLGSGSEHMQFSNVSINTYTTNANTVKSNMYLQNHGTGGLLQLGNDSTEVNIPSRVIRVGSNYVYIGGGTWGEWCGYSLRAPIDNDMWFDPTRNGIYFRGGSSWVTLAGPPA